MSRETLPVAYVVEDDPPARDLIIGLLSGRACEIHAFETAEALLEACPLRRPCCVITDLGLPGIGGLELQRRLERSQPGLPLIVVTGRNEVPLARAALLAGAVDYLLKPIDAGDLLGAVQRAWSSDEHRLQRRRELLDLEQRFAALTQRERDAFRLVTDGLHNQEIATRLDLSVRTVEAHRASIMKKLGTERSAQWFRLRGQFEGGSDGEPGSTRAS